MAEINNSTDVAKEHLEIRRDVQEILRRIRGDDRLIVTRLRYETESRKQDVA